VAFSGPGLLLAGVVLLLASQLRLGAEHPDEPLPWLLSPCRRPGEFEAEKVDGVALLVFGDVLLDEDVGQGVLVAVVTLVSLAVSSRLITVRHNRRIRR
jgi:hypothetical protein